MIPEKKRLRHWKNSLNDECRSDCPACIQDETYKRLAEWIWNNCIIDDYGVVALEFYTDAAKADLEALKKLASEGG